ncbi:MAG: MoxR family ATPase, partial [Myxococcales bacterium]|nr:MoxR family ATPase [Myxococcales bacterium]
MWHLEAERLVTAEARFRAFFEELDSVFIERQDVIQQIALALLCREHVLMTGPPGTAKSALASAVIGRIPDERTGAPSVFSRQVTESTVNTDLVGPIDFKTLMASGRTEHFTDEGMLGAVHAFLDEVLDGRDMLLRSTLNLLEERELKHGHKVTHGEIETALMTTNRYIADVLEHSHETLLAFIDRIAFVSFVPRGFADPESMPRLLHGMVGGAGLGKLRALLTVQDLDALQAAVDRVHVPAAMTDRLAVLMRIFDAEVAATRRADLRFTPTRYLSARTAVRLGRVLRAATVYDRIFHRPGRALRVQFDDFELLRTSLLLTGPTREQLQPLIESETDPTERRQLELVRREREIFDACLSRLPDAGEAEEPETIDAKALVERAQSELRGEQSALTELAGELSLAIEHGAEDSEGLAQLLREVLDEVAQRASVAGLTAGIGPEPDIQVRVAELSDIADRIEAQTRGQRPIARWLRGQAVALIDHTMGNSPSRLGDALAKHLASEVSVPHAIASSMQLLQRVRQLLQLRDHLLSLGAEVGDAEHSAQLWSKGLENIEREMVPLWDDALRLSVQKALGGRKSHDLSSLLEDLEPTLKEIDDCSALLLELRGEREDDPTALKARIAGPRIAPLVQASFERFDASDRMQVTREVEGLLAQLKGAGLRHAVPASELLTWTARALLQSERGRHTDPERLPADHAGYRELRNQEARVSITYVLVDLVTRLHGVTTELRTSPGQLEAT